MTYSESEKEQMIKCIDKMFPGLSPDLKETLRELSKVIY